MKLTNFEQVQNVSLSGMGLHWDLHNHWDFAGIELLQESGAVRLRWKALDEYVDSGNRALTCAMRFGGVSAMWVTKAKARSHPGNATTLYQMGLVAPLERTPAKAIDLGARISSTSEDSHYRFEFMDGFDIEIAASEVTLEADFGTASSAGP